MTVSAELRALLSSSLPLSIIQILWHTDPSLIGRCGRLVTETAQMLTLVEEGRLIHVPKEGGRFQLRWQGRLVTIDGALLKGMPKQRSKRKLHSW